LFVGALAGGIALLSAAIGLVAPSGVLAGSLTGVIGSVGSAIGLTAPAGVGAATSTNYFDGFRVILSIVAMITAGGALTSRPRWPGSWIIAATVCLVAGLGFPSSWDSFRMVAFVMAAVAAVGAALAALPLGWRVSVVSAGIVFHFSGILNAIVLAPPNPDFAMWSWISIYRPYLTFAYLNNAYQFYAPDPGPASELWFCIYYENRPDNPVVFEKLQQKPDGEPFRDSNRNVVYKTMMDENNLPTGRPVKDAEGNWIFKPETDKFGNALERPRLDLDGNPEFLSDTAWLKIPRRPRDYKDPLGPEYYRRLSITENASNGSPGSSQFSPAVWAEVQTRRNTKTDIPFSPIDANQYRWPGDVIANLMIPSYVRHVAHEFSSRPIASIKVYRVQHNIAEARSFVGAPPLRSRTRPYSMTTYFPYYFGEFTPDGEMINKNDPMLYWLVPINPSPDARFNESTDSDSRQMSLSEYGRVYDDYVERHARSSHMKGELK